MRYRSQLSESFPSLPGRSEVRVLQSIKMPGPSQVAKGLRQSISDSQRRALRTWYRSQYPRPLQKKCVEWFHQKFKHRISQSTVSEILSKKYSYLDQDSSTAQGSRSSKKDRRRNRKGNWPILEAILFDWQQSIQSEDGTVTGDMIIEKAHEVWDTIPQYAHLEKPDFSRGWLDGFKKRHNLKRRILHGEASSANAAVEEMESLRKLCAEYSDNDIYNMDETGLFWRQGPSSGLATQPMPGLKKDKSRITIVACTNSTGTDRLQCWFIGKARQPHSLRGLNMRAIGGVWTSNKKAWMAGMVMKDWLKEFYGHVGGRNVLLLMDNFKAHIEGVELAPPPPNVRIQWLPPNSTSLYQPLDQGILKNLKHHYRKQWLRFIIRGFEQNTDPFQKVSLHHAVHWVLHAWNQEVTNSTIQNCFRKSTLIQGQMRTQETETPQLEISRLYDRIRESGRIKDMMSLDNFLNPEDETPSMTEQETLEAIIAYHTGADNVEEEPDSDGDGPQPVPSIKETLEAVRTMLRYKEHREDTKPEDIRLLQRLERDLLADQANGKKQWSLDAWFSG